MSRPGQRFMQALGNAEFFLVGACLVLAVTLNVTLVFLRFAFDYSANAMEEIAVYAVIWMVFLGALVSDRHGTHINIDILYHFVSARVRRGLQRAASLMQGLVCLTLAVLTAKTVLFTLQLGEVSLSTLRAPVWILMAVMPPTFLVLGCRGVARALGILPLSSQSGSEAHL